MASVNLGVCEQCEKRIPVRHLVEDGHVYMIKECPDCGEIKSMISSDAARWQEKRDLVHYDEDKEDDKVQCAGFCEACHLGHKPKVVFVDTTNRCNLNCPICLANVPGMGFEFYPPLSYFERIFDELGTWDPKPRVELFGGEPTVRHDLFEIIAACRRNGLPISLVTNSVRLADEDFCKKVCDERVDMLLAFDGRGEEIYKRMRGSTVSYEKKLQALENVKKHSQRKHTIVCTVAHGLNDGAVMEDYFQFIHDYRDITRRLFFIPLAEMWEGGEYETKTMTTPEDVEKIIDDAFGEESASFVPLAVFTYLAPAQMMFGTSKTRFAGVHPNCESATFLVSNGERYLPIDHFMTMSFKELIHQVIERARVLNPKLAKLDRSKAAHRVRGRAMVLKAYMPLVYKAFDFKKIFKRPRWFSALRFVTGLLMGRKTNDLLAKYTYTKQGVDVTILPFEERHSLEGARLERCTAGFVYLDPKTDELKSVPFCMWTFYRKHIMRELADKFEAEQGDAPAGKPSAGK